ncbi:hypothetical protein ACFHWD_16920 [Clostridium sp. MT-14]|jgi:hypothetical protein|uniref:hypothetical protein n=1 Tax=Clostridium sp. MT-14 TaxID=3348360 RepID=UPI0035F3560B
MEPEQNSQNPQSQNDDEPLDEDIEFVIMAMAKREHLSLEELNLFRVKDFFKFSKKYGDTFDTKKNKKNARRRATQADIDKFYG